MADIKNTYVASAPVVITLTSLATDANLLAGRSSAVFDNSGNKYLDYLIGGLITTGTTPTTAKVIEVWAWSLLNDTPTYPDAITGSDANATVTNRDILASFGRLLASMPTVGASNQGYPFGPVSVASLFGGVCPAKFGVFVVHNTAATLNSTPANHHIKATGVYASAS